MQSRLSYIEDFKKRKQGSDPAWLEELRQAAMTSFGSLGFPTTKSEDWKYTNIEPMVSLPYVSSNGEACRLATAELLAGETIDPEAPRLVFINGLFAPQHSSTANLPEGVRVASLAASIDRDDRGLASRLGRRADYSRHAFVALNTAFLKDGAFVSVEAGCHAPRPIYLIYVVNAGERRLLVYPRSLIALGAGSEVKIVESYSGMGGGSYFSNAVTELIAEEDVHAEHYRLQRESEAAVHVGALDASLARGSHLTAHAVTLSGMLVRNNVRVVLDGEGAECVLNGLYLGDGKRHVDNFTEIEHRVPRASSSELYKGILDGASRGVFNGKIVVHKDAQKTNARQTNKNLLLSGEAMVNTKPQLEIYADDVKCSHGSTIGQLDADALFYLRSRGLGVEAARSLLSFAFAGDVIGRITIDSLRQRLDDYLVSKFGGV